MLLLIHLLIIPRRLLSCYRRIRFLLSNLFVNRYSLCCYCYCWCYPRILVVHCSLTPVTVMHALLINLLSTCVKIEIEITHLPYAYLSIILLNCFFCLCFVPSIWIVKIVHCSNPICYKLLTCFRFCCYCYSNNSRWLRCHPKDNCKHFCSKSSLSPPHTP